MGRSNRAVAELRRQVKVVLHEASGKGVELGLLRRGERGFYGGSGVIDLLPSPENREDIGRAYKG